LSSTPLENSETVAIGETALVDRKELSGWIKIKVIGTKQDNK